MIEDARRQIEESRRLVEQVWLAMEGLKADVAYSKSLIAEIKRLLEMADL
jgi:hypothetical protein